VSSVLVAGRPAIRACVISWRTRSEDIVTLCAALNQQLATG
jgi:hypothetical protein